MHASPIAHPALRPQDKIIDTPDNPMRPEDAARIQSAEASKHGGIVDKDSFASRAERAAAKNEQAGKGDDSSDP